MGSGRRNIMLVGWLVSWSLTSLFSTNTAIYQTRVGISCRLKQLSPAVPLETAASDGGWADEGGGRCLVGYWRLTVDKARHSAVTTTTPRLSVTSVTPSSRRNWHRHRRVLCFCQE